jgi:hypothetical protein
MVSRLRKTLTAQQRTAAFEHTYRVAAEATDEERRRRNEKNQKLRALRLAADRNATVRCDTHHVAPLAIPYPAKNWR